MYFSFCRSLVLHEIEKLAYQHTNTLLSYKFAYNWKGYFESLNQDTLEEWSYYPYNNPYRSSILCKRVLLLLIEHLL